MGLFTMEDGGEEKGDGLYTDETSDIRTEELHRVYHDATSTNAHGPTLSLILG